MHVCLRVSLRGHVVEVKGPGRVAQDRRQVFDFDGAAILVGHEGVGEDAEEVDAKLAERRNNRWSGCRRGWRQGSGSLWRGVVKTQA